MYDIFKSCIQKEHGKTTYTYICFVNFLKKKQSILSLLFELARNQFHSASSGCKALLLADLVFFVVTLVGICQICFLLC